MVINFDNRMYYVSKVWRTNLHMYSITNLMQGKMKNNLHRDLDLIQFGGKYQRAEVVALLESELYNHHIPATKTNTSYYINKIAHGLAKVNLPERDGDSCNCQCYRQTLTQLDNKTHRGGDNRFLVRIQRNVLYKFLKYE